jgi:hypothetical protein
LHPPRPLTGPSWACTARRLGRTAAQSPRARRTPWARGSAFCGTICNGMPAAQCAGMARDGPSDRQAGPFWASKQWRLHRTRRATQVGSHRSMGFRTWLMGQEGWSAICLLSVPPVAGRRAETDRGTRNTPSPSECQPQPTAPMGAPPQFKPKSRKPAARPNPVEFPSTTPMRIFRASLRYPHPRGEGRQKSSSKLLHPTAIKRPKKTSQESWLPVRGGVVWE